MASGADLDLTQGGVTVRVTGLRDLVRNLERAGVAAEDIKEVMGEAGEIVARRAITLAPSRTGKLKANIRASKAKTKASIKAGSARVPYARFVYFGRYNAEKGGLYQKENPFLFDAVRATRTQVFNKIEEGIGDILKRNNLD